MTTMQTPIPVIDFSPFVDVGNAAEEQQRSVGAKIDDAFQSVGFVYLVNHGVSPERVRECFEWSARFFDLPPSTKMLAPHPPGGSHHRGYSAPGVEKVSQMEFDKDKISELRQVPDFKESFESGNENDEFQPNIWLDDKYLPGFRSFMEGFFKDCSGLIHRVLQALAIPLSLPRDYLSKRHSRDLFQLRLLHYPPIPAAAILNSTHSRISAHSDFGTLTLLFQDDVGGLEVENPHKPGAFRPAPPIEGSVLVNVGDLMARWSNDRWRSTVHRVGVPPSIFEEQESAKKANRQADREVICKSRYSIPFFATVNLDALVDALPGTWGEGIGPKKYEVVTAGEYVQMRMAALYD